ncbi:MAG: DUF169 domain-containing protein [Candidatus Marinimicrobia bacterium]|nr:DUF169 domain-containing protein [Candidatus Neomarinimicrobiota bacterium]
MLKNTAKYAQKIKEILNLSSDPVGVKFYFKGDRISANAQRLMHHRYCQALMKARHGEHVLLDADGISCPAAAAAFGFKPLARGLRTGKGLQGFGIVQSEANG